MKKLFAGIMLVCSATTFANTEINNINPSFYQKVKHIENKQFEGVDNSGTNCFVTILKVVEKGNQFDSVRMRFIISSEMLPSELLDAETTEDYFDIMFSNYGTYPYDFKVNYKVIGSTGLVGRVSRLNKRVLGLHNDSQTSDGYNKYDEMKILLSNDEKSIEEVKIIKYKHWYIPVAQIHLKESEDVCTITN